MSHPYDQLTPDTVIASVEAVGFRCDLRLLALNSYENRVYQVGLEDADPIIVKFYRPERWSVAQILEEHQFALELAEAELSVVAPLVIDGDTLFQTEAFTFAVFPRRGGYPPELDNLDNLFILGRTLGRLHAVGAATPFVHRPTFDGSDSIGVNAHYLAQHWVPRELLPAYTSLMTDITQGVQAILGTQRPSNLLRLHGDCHPGNILWRDNIPHIVDLDDAINGPAIQDLWMLLSGETDQKERQLAEIVAGYEEFADFDPQQIRWIEALRALRLVRHAAWIGRRWDDPAFPKAFPWFGEARFWSDHILQLREQLAALQEPPLRLL
jgi:Ser/Thr protein kinase RdoA (MazF antagonist)